MRISSRFRINTIFSIIMIFIIGLTKLIVFNHMNSALLKVEIVHEIARDAFALNVITFDYLANPSDRARMQWHMKHESLKKVMEKLGLQGVKEKMLFNRLKRSHEDMKAVFFIIASDNETQTLIDDTSNISSQIKADQRKRFAAQLLIKSQNVISCADRLNAINLKELSRIQRNGSLLVLFMVLFMGILITINSAFISRSITRPINRLCKGSGIIGKGNLNHVIRIDSQDEIGELSEAFNNMAKNLAFITVSRDKLTKEIKERIKAEKAQKEMEAQLWHQQRLESMGTLAGGVAHEINNPINGIMNYAQLIKDRLEPENSLLEFADEIILETNRVASIVRNLLAFARQEKQGYSPARICDIAEKTLSLIRTVIRHDHITIKTDIPENLPKINCRSQQIQQVLMNLMINARDALNERWPGYDENKIINLKSVLTQKKNGKWIRTIVEDNGTGISNEIENRIFDPFFSTKPREKGTGLGLAISYGIITEHKGILNMESRPGQYTCFYFDLPVDNGLNFKEDELL